MLVSAAGAKQTGNPLLPAITAQTLKDYYPVSPNNLSMDSDVVILVSFRTSSEGLAQRRDIRSFELLATLLEKRLVLGTVAEL